MLVMWSLIILNVFSIETRMLQGGQRAGSSNDFWNRYKEDLALAKALNCTFFRFSLEWSRIEPQRGHIDQEAVYRYNQILDEVLRQAISCQLCMRSCIRVTSVTYRERGVLIAGLG